MPCRRQVVWLAAVPCRRQAKPPEAFDLTAAGYEGTTDPHPKHCSAGKDAVSQDNKTLASKLAASPIWLSLTVDADTFPSSSQEYDPLTDWKIVAAAPLVLENQLPVAGTYLVWEKPKVGVSLPDCNSIAALYRPVALHVCGASFKEVDTSLPDCSLLLHDVARGLVRASAWCWGKIPGKSVLHASNCCQDEEVSSGRRVHLPLLHMLSRQQGIGKEMLVN